MHTWIYLYTSNLDKRDITIISRSCYNLKANIRIELETKEDIEINRGVRQGCIRLPILFNLFSKDIVNTALLDKNLGIKINCIKIIEVCR